MAFLDPLDDFITSHVWVLITWISLILTIIMVLNILSFWNAYRGTKHPFPIALSLGNIVNCLIYIVFSVIRLGKGKSSQVLLYLGLVLVCLTHWLLAFRYYQSTVEIPYVREALPVPAKLIMLNKTLFWV